MKSGVASGNHFVFRKVACNFTPNTALSFYNVPEVECNLPSTFILQMLSSVSQILSLQIKSRFYNLTTSTTQRIPSAVHNKKVRHSERGEQYSWNLLR